MLHNIYQDTAKLHLLLTAPLPRFPLRTTREGHAWRF